MRRRRGWGPAVVVGVLMLANGCALISIRTEKRSEPPGLYSAARLDVSLALTGWDAVPVGYRPSIPVRVAMVPLGLVDGVFSIVGDTLLLPYDSYHWARLQADRDFWKGVFQGGGALLAVADMHRHLTRYSAETVAWHVESELAREGDPEGEAPAMVAGMGIAWGVPTGQAPKWPMLLNLAREPMCGLEGGMELGGMGELPTGPRPEEPDGLAEKERETPEPERRQRRAARLDRLIDAEIALAALAGRPDLSSAQMNRLLPYAKRRADVRLALVGNPSTPPDMIDGLLADPSPEELQALAYNPSLSPVWAQRIARGKDDTAAEYLASSPTLTPALMADLDARKSWGVQYSLAHRGDLPDSYAWRYIRVRDYLALETMIQAGRTDLPVDVLRGAVSLRPTGSGRWRWAILNAMPRQRHAPPDLLQLAWEEGALTIHDILLRPDLPQYCFDAMATAVTRAKAFDPETMAALIPKVGSGSLQGMRKRVDTERTRASERGDTEALTRCRKLVAAIDAQLRPLCTD